MNSDSRLRIRLQGPPYPADYLRYRALRLERQKGERLRKRILARDGMWCGICDGAVEGAFQIDHIVPLAVGGLSVEENMRVAHPRCNLLKGALP